MSPAADITAGITAVIARLDSIGFDYGHTRISLWRAILVLVVIAVVYLAGRIANRGVVMAFRRISRLDPAQRVLGEKLVGILVWLLCILIGIDFLGIDLTALTVFSGAFGLAVGFGLQKTFGNLLAGIILLMDRSIKPGDVIAVGGANGTVGQVEKIGMRAVSVITRDKIEYLIPNENLMANQVENWSFSSKQVRVKVPVSIADGADVTLAERLMLEAASKIPRVRAKPAPDVWMRSFGTNAIEYELQLWIDDPENGVGNLRSDVLKRVYRLFVDNGVPLPNSQHEVHVKEWPGPPMA